MDCCQTENNSCGCNTACCRGTEQNQKAEKRTLMIDFLYLDLDVCTRCQGTSNTLEEAIAEVIKVLELTGVKVILNKIHINSAEKAVQYEFISSPTIRVNGRDIQLEVKESQCESCGDLCGDEVDCRVWVYEGKEYTVPPKAMIIDAILREIYGDAKARLVSNVDDESKYQLPENLKSFFEAMEKKFDNK
ncbi:DUF2703 domain-containing protein [Petroclostridium sp. X23]|uniref:DUF2703 domain-containing protein n=1 Tax=Petroclostridium sp. X23 TaxID=3045146 RepID=UPI0024ACA69A|nr:DUF2703 domain-containing protein [Petroclostridium sp. X23]WHH57933.1 DUF2703 domain-containing protein [Petroclostridium sp. X23]